MVEAGTFWVVRMVSMQVCRRKWYRTIRVTAGDSANFVCE